MPRCLPKASGAQLGAAPPPRLMLLICVFSAFLVVSLAGWINFIDLFKNKLWVSLSPSMTLGGCSLELSDLGNLLETTELARFLWPWDSCFLQLSLYLEPSSLRTKKKRRWRCGLPLGTGLHCTAPPGGRHAFFSEGLYLVPTSVLLLQPLLAGHLGLQRERIKMERKKSRDSPGTGLGDAGTDGGQVLLCPRLCALLSVKLPLRPPLHGPPLSRSLLMTRAHLLPRVRVGVQWERSVARVLVVLPGTGIHRVSLTRI